MFKTFDDIKRVAEKFNKGSIVPQRVLKADNRKTKKFSHNIKFGMDLYRLKGLNGNEIFVADWSNADESTCLIRLNTLLPIQVTGNYHGSGECLFQGNWDGDNESWIRSINKAVFGAGLV